MRKPDPLLPAYQPEWIGRVFYEGEPIDLAEACAKWDWDELVKVVVRLPEMNNADWAAFAEAAEWKVFDVSPNNPDNKARESEEEDRSIEKDAREELGCILDLSGEDTPEKQNWRGRARQLLFEKAMSEDAGGTFHLRFQKADRAR